MSIVATGSLHGNQKPLRSFHLEIDMLTGDFLGDF